MKSMGQLDEKVRLIRLRFKVSLTSRGTPLPVIDRDQIIVLNEMFRLSGEGLNAVQIAARMNDTGWKPKLVGAFYGKLVWASLKKYRQRLAREHDYVVHIVEEYLEFC
ncbi:MAG: hypothetical protein O9331_16110 [Acidovorax sp.]|nr:hypothetical protein [Limnobacter sp.]MCZ8074455.1 hypothetical protein [Roseateles sp.]MCZ8095003.1 hypothetical protein [Acidovorax sp.]MCZ8227677.1 hypothetical protein [Burkholderiaceae bacterium]